MAKTFMEEIRELKDDGAIKVAPVDLTPGIENAFAFVWQNPEATKIMVQRVIVRIGTGGGTASAVVDAGVVANATATADNLLDGLDITEAGLFDNITDKGSNGKSRQLVDEKGGSNDYITGKILTAAASNLAGTVYIYYTKARA